MAKILVVDDEKDVVELLTFLLQKDGYTVVNAQNGKEALDVVPKEKPDLILLDVMMPELDGYTVQTRLLEDPATKGIPIIILTAKGHLRDIFAMSANVTAYIEKPFDPKTLRAKIQEALRNKL
ncbi:MAG: response regulator [Elusimicrobia bacterium]|nr:response regulator [Candidatus Obscuribacterium magneticum]